MGLFEWFALFELNKISSFLSKKEAKIQQERQKEKSPRAVTSGSSGSGSPMQQRNNAFEFKFKWQNMSWDQSENDPIQEFQCTNCKRTISYKSSNARFYQNRKQCYECSDIKVNNY